jgi:hypothetical protein
MTWKFLSVVYGDCRSDPSAFGDRDGVPHEATWTGAFPLLPCGR